MIELVPISQRAARKWINENHRHLSVPQGDLYRTSLVVDGKCVAVAIAGRPCRMLQNGKTVEITRVASVAPIEVNACSRLYASLVRAGKSLGYTRFITYTLMDEPGISLKASGFRFAGVTNGGEWSRPSRIRKPQEQPGKKKRWIIPDLSSNLWPKGWKESE